MSAPIAHGEGAGGLLVAHLGEPVGIHRIDVVILLERKGVEVLVALGEADSIGRLARGDDDLAHAEFHRRLDDVVGADHIFRERDVVRFDQHPRNGGEMHDRVGRARRPADFEALEAAVDRQGVERLAAVGQIGDHRWNACKIKRFEVDVEDVIAVGDEMRDRVAAGLAGSAGEDDALASHGGPRETGKRTHSAFRRRRGTGCA